MLAVDALHSALAAAVEQVRLAPVPGRIVVAMSGGVDSAVALTKAVEAGMAPVGVTLRLWVDPMAPHGERACCSPQAVRAARDACHALGVPHLAIDLREGFRRTVVDDFVSAHAAGLTPNPCVRCNGEFRFSAITAVADAIGAARIATGHYARIVQRSGTALVSRGADPAKDQSYMLASVPSEVLARCWFPLGGQTKVADPGGSAGGGTRGRRGAREPGGVLRRRRRSPSAGRAPGRRGPGRRHRRRLGAGAREAHGPAPVHAGAAAGPRPGGRRRRSTSFARSPPPAGSSWAAARTWRGQRSASTRAGCTSPPTG